MNGKHTLHIVTVSDWMPAHVLDVVRSMGGRLLMQDAAFQTKQMNDDLPEHWVALRLTWVPEGTVEWMIDLQVDAKHLDDSITWAESFGAALRVQLRQKLEQAISRSR